MENGIIQDSQLSASSHAGYHDETKARLNGVRGWRPAYDEKNPMPWIQVSFRQLTDVAGIATQGQGDGRMDEWVTVYRVNITTDNNTWDRITNSTGSHVSTNSFLYNASDIELT